MADEWFEGGFKRAREVKESQDSGNYEFGNNEKSRFWVTVGKERKIIFLDNFEWKVDRGGFESPVVPLLRNEYKVNLNNFPDAWKNCVYITAHPDPNEPSLPRERGFSRVYMGALTVLDVTPFKDDSGETKMYPRKKLFVAVPSALSVLESKLAKKGNLQGWQFSIARHEKRSPRVGNDFEPEKQFSVEELRKEFPNVNLDPLGFTAEEAMKFYMELFAPMPYEQQKKLFEGCNPIDGWKSFKGSGAQPVSSGASVAAGAPSADGGDDDGDVISY